MTQPIYHHKFRPWRVVGDHRIVSAESAWKKPIRWNAAAARCCRKEACDYEHEVGCAQRERPRVLVDVDVFEDWQGPVIRRQSELTVCHGCGKFGSLGEVIDCGGGKHLCSRMPRKATLDDVRARLFRTIDQTPNLDWLLLTKRPENVRQMLPRIDCVVYRDGGNGLRTIGIDSEDRAGALRQYRSNLWLGVSISCQEDADRLIPELLKCRDLCAKTFVMRDTEMEIV